MSNDRSYAGLRQKSASLKSNWQRSSEGLWNAELLTKRRVAKTPEQQGAERVIDLSLPRFASREFAGCNRE
jgi:hypothetical protein